MIRAAGDSAVVSEGAGRLRVISPRGVVADFERVVAHAVLADPPRLAMLRAEPGRVEIVDVASGVVERVAGSFTPLAFAAGGSALFGVQHAGIRDVLVALDDDGVVSQRSGRALLDVAFGARAIFAGPVNVDDSRDPFQPALSPRPEFILSDGDHTLWTAASAARPVGFDQDATGRGARIAVLEWFRGELRSLSSWDASSGAPLETLCSCDDAIVAVWMSLDFAAFIVLDARGRILRRRRDARRVAAADSSVNQAPIALGPRAQPLSIARTSSAHGLVAVDVERTASMCVSGAGVVVALDHGMLQRHDGWGSVLVDGPAGLVAIAPHPRGVIAVDRDDRAYVIELDVAVDVDVAKLVSS